MIDKVHRDGELALRCLVSDLLAVLMCGVGNDLIAVFQVDHIRPQNLWHGGQAKSQRDEQRETPPREPVGVANQVPAHLRAHHTPVKESAYLTNLLPESVRHWDCFVRIWDGTSYFQ